MGRVREEEEGKTEGVAKRVRKRIEEVGGESRRKKIEESKYNSRYKEIATKERPEYLKRRMRKKERSLIARFRCGNEVGGRQHWREEENRRCRICKEEEETLEHVIERCEVTRGGPESKRSAERDRGRTRRDEENTEGKKKEKHGRGKRAG